MKKITSLLLCAALMLSLMPLSVVFAEEKESEETVLSEGGITVTGDLPLNTVLNVENKEDPFDDTAAKEENSKSKKLKAAKDLTVSEQSETAENSDNDLDNEKRSAFTYDITLVAEGEAVQLKGTVKLSFDDVPYYDGGYIEVYHVLDSAEAIRSGKGVAVEDPEFVKAFPEEERITAEVTGKAGVVYVEFFSLEDGTVYIDEKGLVSINVSSFSTYYVVSGDTRNGSSEKDVVYIYDDNDNTYYVMPGTTIQFIRRNDFGIAANADYTWAKMSSNSISGLSATFNNGQNVSTSWARASYGRPNIVVSVPTTATSGTLVLNTARGLGIRMHQSDITMIVMSQEDIISHIMTNTQYPVYLAINRDTSNGIPGEPGISSASWYYGDANLNVVNSGLYAATASGVIDQNISSNPNFINSADGTNTMGIADVTGTNTKAAVNGIDWNLLLDNLARRGNVRASDGTVLTSSNKANYEVIPYVVKLQTAYSLGWHIDCMVAPKEKVTVSYNPNLPVGYTVANISLPQSYSGVSPLSVTIEKPKQDGSDINVNGTVPAVKGNVSYMLTFKGWNTKSDASGTSYLPGTTPSFTENTTLYAIWESDIAEGTLDIRKNVRKGENADDPPETDTFTFTATFPTTAGTRPYTVYDLFGKVKNTGSIASGGTLSLKGGEWARITGVPRGAYNVTEAVNENYQSSNTGAAGTIVGGATSTAEFTNEYIVPAHVDYTVKHILVEPDGTENEQVGDRETKSGQIGTLTEAAAKVYVNYTARSFEQETIAANGSTVVEIRYDRQLGNLTVAKAGAESIDENQTFLFRVTGNGVDVTVTVHGNDSVTLQNVPAGEYTVTELTEWSWRYTPDIDEKSVTVTGNENAGVAFINERTDDKKLDNSAYRVNLFTIRP